MQFYIDPVFIHLGPLSIHYYGIVYALTILLAYYIFRKTFSENDASALILYMGLGLMVGGRIGHYLFFNPSLFWTRPWELLFIWNGGMAFFGATAGIALGAWLFCKQKKISFTTVSDKLVVIGTIGLIFGRIANFINQELVGTVTNVPWCFYFVDHANPGVVFEAVCRHPYQLYAALSHILLLGLLYFVYRRTKDSKPGALSLTFILGYTGLRFITDFWRAEYYYIFGLTIWQLLSIIIFIGTLIWVYTHGNNKSKHNNETNKKKNNGHNSKKSKN